MSLYIRIIAVFVCIGAGIASQSALAGPPLSVMDLFSIFRTSYKSPFSKNEGQTDEASATSHHRLARTYADRHDIDKAHSHFGLALSNATPRLIPGIAVDYAGFLSENGDLHRAELMLRQALAQAPNDREIIKLLARCLVRQNKTFEGLRYFNSIGSEAEARAEIAAIYREQGNTDMLVAMERRWGEPTGTARQEPVLIAGTPKSTALPPAPPVVRQAGQSASKSEFFDTRVPIPVPNTDSRTMVVAATVPKPVVPTSASVPVPVSTAASVPRPAPVSTAAPAPVPAPVPASVSAPDAKKLSAPAPVAAGSSRAPSLHNPVTLTVAPPTLPKRTESSQ